MSLTPAEHARLTLDLIAVFRRHGVTHWRGEFDVEDGESRLRVLEIEAEQPPSNECDGHCSHVKLEAGPYGVYPKP